MTKKRWLILAILTFLTVCGWVIANILHTRTSVEIPPKVQELIEPLNPEFDLSGLEDK